MPLKIIRIEADSIAEKAGLKAGDEILKINDRNINDRFDLYYFGARREIHVRISQPGGKSKGFKLKRKADEDWGIEAEEYKQRTCVNHCVFCFIDQMPPGLRPSLYVKDDDYIHSVLHGSYITLSNLKHTDLKRIYGMDLSPLYISLHTTNDALRQQIMRYKEPLNVLNTLRHFSERKLDFHLQFVLVPGVNDGVELRRSLYQLLSNELNILSIGVVPVGLTRYREKLCKLQPFTKQGAIETLDIIDEMREKFDFIDLFAADEFYLLAEREIPDDEYYQDYPQLENGIGLLRLGQVQYLENKAKLIKAFDPKGSYRVFCSESAEGHIRSIFQDLAGALPLAEFHVQSLKADFFGGYVNVAGLLSYQDFAQQAQLKTGETAVIPRHILNYDNLSLDGHHLQEFSSLFAGKLLLMDPLFEGWQKA